MSAATGVCDVPVISTVCSTVSESAGTLVAAPFAYLASSAGGAAQWMFQSVWDVFDASAIVDVTSDAYVRVYNVLFGVAIFVMLLFFFLQLLTGLARRDPGALARASLGLAKSVLGSFLVVTLTGTALTIVDELCVGIVQATGTTMAGLGTRIAALGLGLTAINVGTPGTGAIITIFLAGLAIAATALLWFSLLIRKALLLVAIVLAPIALSGSVWDATRAWAPRWAGFVAALIVSKVMIVIVFLVATAELTSPIGFDLASISNVIAGIVLMFVAAFAPYVAYRFISFMGFDLYHAVATEQDAKQALNRPVPLPTRPTPGSARSVLGGTGTGGTARGSGGGPTPPAPKPGGTGAGPASGAGTAAAAEGGASGAAGAGAAGSAAGPIALGAIAGAKINSAAAAAGPRLGAAIGQTAGQGTSAASAAPASPTPAAAPPPPVIRPAPPVYKPPTEKGIGS